MLVRLVLIGLAAGFFSAVFGVGGGIIAVPLLLLAGLDIRRATATSLAAIVIIALAGTILYGLRGEVRPEYAALVGVPAVLGAVIGARLQQRITTRALTFGFAALLAVVGVVMLV